MISLNLESILNFLQKKNHLVHLQKETNQVCVIFKEGQREFPLFIRIAEGGELLQLLTFIPSQMKKETLPEVARLLHLLNKELDLPGFGLNEETGHIFFRCTIPCVRKQVDSSTLDAFVQASHLVCKNFSGAVEAIAAGSITLDELLKRKGGHL